MPKLSVCSSFLGANVTPADLGSSFLGSSFLGSSFLGSSFLGSSFLDSSFLGSSLTTFLASSSAGFFSSTTGVSSAFGSSSRTIPILAACLRRLFSSILAKSSADKVLYLGLSSEPVVVGVLPDNCIASCSFFSLAALAAFSFSTCALTAAINASL